MTNAGRTGERQPSSSFLVGKEAQGSVREKNFGRWEGQEACGNGLCMPPAIPGKVGTEMTGF